jgi:hypothetical protein
MAVNVQQLEANGVYEGKSSVTTLLADLDQIITLANAKAAAKSKQGKLGGYMILAGVIAAVIAAAVFPPLLVFAILDIVAGLGVWLHSMFTRGKLLEHPKRLAITKERLAMIQCDCRPEKPFSLRLCLASNPIRLSQEPWHGRKGGNQEFFEEAWLSLEGPLMDGSVLTDEIKELSRKRHFSNARGKRKTKSKVTYLVNVRFCYPQQRYGDARAAEQALKGQVKLGPSATLRSVKVTEKAIALKAMVATDQEIAKTAGMLSLGCYRILNLAHRMAAGSKGPAPGGTVK